VGKNAPKFGKNAKFGRFFGHNTIQYNTINTIQYDLWVYAVFLETIQYNTIQYLDDWWEKMRQNSEKMRNLAVFLDTIQYNTIQSIQYDLWVYAVFLDITQYNTIQYNMICEYFGLFFFGCNTNTIQYNTIQ